MNLSLKIAGWRVPAFIKKRELNHLFRLTAIAFDADVPPLRGLSYDARLAEYARFTRAAVDRTVARGGNLGDAENRLFQGAFDYGKKWRKRLGVSGMGEIMKAAHMLYHAIGIEFRGDDSGDVEIGKCFFSPHYSPTTCKVISSLDAGMMAGLSDGMAFTFSRRITEGSPCCVARLSSGEKDA